MSLCNCRTPRTSAAPLIALLWFLTVLGSSASGQCGPTVSGRFGGETTGLTRVDGDTLLVVNGTNVELVSVFNSFQPTPFSPRRTAPLNGPAVKLDMRQGASRAFALLANGDVQVFSVAYSPSLSVQPHSTIPSGDAVDIAAASNNHVCIATQTESLIGFESWIDSEVTVYDGFPAVPLLRSTFEPLSAAYGYDRIGVVGDTLWAAFHELESSIFGVEGFNIANPAAVTRGAAALNNVPLGEHVRITALGAGVSRLVVGYRYSSVTQYLAAIEVSTPSTPAWRPALTVNTDDDVTAMATFGTLVRAAFGHSGVRTYNFFDQFNPMETGVHTDAFPHVGQMIIAGGGIDWWSGGPAGVMSMNTSNPSAVSMYWSEPVRPTAPSVVRQRGNTTVVLDYTLNQLLLFDYTLSEPQQHRGTIQLPLYSELVEIGEASGGFTLACVASKGNPAGDVIAVYDITNPTAPIHRSTITGFRPHLMSVSSSRMYVFTTASEFKIIELAFPATPAVRSTTTYGGNYWNYTALTSWSNNAAALGTSAMGLWLINTTNATSPVVSGIWNPATGYSVHALAKGPGVLYVSATAATPTVPPAPPATHTRFESLLVTNLAAPAQRFLHSPTSGAGSQGLLDSLTYVPTPAGNFVVATRRGVANYPDTYDAATDSARLYALGSFFATENVTAPVASVTLEQARGNVAPGGASAPGGGSGSARFIAAADEAGLYQVGMPPQWAPAFAAIPVSAAVCHGADTFFNSLVSANPTAVTFQWYRGGTPLTNGPTPWGSTIFGADEPSISITGVRPADRGSYVLVATNSCGGRSTFPVSLTVHSADLGSQGGLPGSDGLFDNNDFIAFINYFFAEHPLADVGKQGGLIGFDYLFDNNDFIAFISLFFGDCP